MTTKNALIEQVKALKCRRCGKPGAAIVKYGGYFMGLFCNDHRPDKVKAKRAVDIMECYEVEKPEPGKPREIYPVEMNSPSHPFHGLCKHRIELGIGRWDLIVQTFVPRSSLTKPPNRAQRRR